MPPKSKKPELIFNDSSGKVIYDELIRLLGLMTAQTWGYHRKGRHSIQYIGVTGMPLRVYVVDPLSVYSHRCSASDNQWHITVAPGDINSPEWESLIAYDLRVKLIRVLSNCDCEQYATMLRLVRAYECDANIAAEHAYIFERHQLHNDVAGKIYNKYIDRCLYDIPIALDY